MFACGSPRGRNEISPQNKSKLPLCSRCASRCAMLYYKDSIYQQHMPYFNSGRTDMSNRWKTTSGPVQSSPDPSGRERPKVLQEFHECRHLLVLPTHRRSLPGHHEDINVRDRVHVLQQGFHVPVGRVKRDIVARGASKGEDEATRISPTYNAHHFILLVLLFRFRSWQ